MDKAGHSLISSGYKKRWFRLAKWETGPDGVGGGTRPSAQWTSAKEGSGGGSGEGAGGATEWAVRYFTSQSEGKGSLKGAIPLRGARLTRSRTSDMEFTIVASRSSSSSSSSSSASSESKSFPLRCATPAEALIWMIKIDKAIRVQKLADANA